MVDLYPHQKEALAKIHNGSIVCGGTGSGKSLTGLAYYFTKNGGKIEDGDIHRMTDIQDLIIITTPKKRDEHEWNGDCAFLGLEITDSPREGQPKIIVDSWNNIKKYTLVKDAFFLFDEQRVKGTGAWVKAFIDIAKKNEWILLTATPGDRWMDYVPVFIANGYYRNRREFEQAHVVYDRYSKFPKINKYVDVGRLIKIKKEILVSMSYCAPADHKVHMTEHEYNKARYKAVLKNRWDYEKECPIDNITSLMYLARKVCNTDESKISRFRTILRKHPKLIVFYNFTYELEELTGFLDTIDYKYAEWNGRKHEEVPSGDEWVYLVQYNSGSEAWNCVTTDTILFYSLSYSYTMMYQASGRINRLNTPFDTLHYYILYTKSSIDKAILHALRNKETFNENNFIKGDKSYEDN